MSWDQYNRQYQQMQQENWRRLNEYNQQVSENCMDMYKNYHQNGNYKAAKSVADAYMVYAVIMILGFLGFTIYMILDW